MNLLKKLNIRVLLGALILSVSTVSFAEISVVVNSANAANIGDSDMSRIFLGKIKKFSTGDKVTLVNLKYNHETRNEFEEKVLKKSASQVKAYWSKLMFSGKGKPPKELASDKDIIAFVAANPGALGYVSSASVDDSVKVIKTF
jgi:ABC-type phosphate transport system substrate-binding protein